MTDGPSSSKPANDKSSRILDKAAEDTETPTESTTGRPPGFYNDVKPLTDAPNYVREIGLD